MLWENSSLKTSVFIVKMADHDGNHRFRIEKNVPKALILPNTRWQYGAESLVQYVNNVY